MDKISIIVESILVHTIIINYYSLIRRRLLRLRLRLRATHANIYIIYNANPIPIRICCFVANQATHHSTPDGNGSMMHGPFDNDSTQLNETRGR